MNSSAPDRAATEITVRRYDASEWPRLRELRLAALRDSPLAFLETYEFAAGRPDSYWQERARRATTGDDLVMFIAEQSGRWIGMAGGQQVGDPPDRVDVVSVWVDPAHRGGPAARALLAAVLDWAAGAPAVGLWVHEDNDRARAFYRRRGFTETGRTAPYVVDPSRDQIEMELTAVSRRPPRE
ncbi:MAG: GNAT family N-acetyltransferase [Actinomycetota bacterium]|nr:GNAT family N-acetyltransferase [Actinomycetota bacterium]